MAMSKTNNVATRMKAAKSRAAKSNDENPIKDGPNSVLDAIGVELAQEWAEKLGLEKLKKLFPDMAALLEEKTDG